MSNPVVRTKVGELRGVVENGVTVFRAVPYAAPPVGELRFASPQPVPAWRGVRDATREGPIAPQGRSRLAQIMGDFQSPQSEDCLTLNIWTPGADSAKRPVLIWIHGGAYSSGAGSLAWYAGDQFAANGDVVAVSINYRLGALGFLCLPGVIPIEGIEDFRAYEDAVLPLLPEFGGCLEHRLRNLDGTVEMHIISFASEADHQNYRNDPRRAAQAWLLENSRATFELLPMANVSYTNAQID